MSPATLLSEGLDRLARRLRVREGAGPAGDAPSRAELAALLAEELAALAAADARDCAELAADWIHGLAAGNAGDAPAAASPDSAEADIVAYGACIDRQQAITQGRPAFFLPTDVYERYVALRDEEARLARRIWSDPAAFGRFVSRWFPSAPRRAVEDLAAAMAESQHREIVAAADRQQRETAQRLMASPPDAKVIRFGAAAQARQAAGR